MKEYGEGKVTRLTPVFDYQKREKELFRPLKYYSYFEKKKMESMVTLGIAQQAAKNYNEEKQKPEVDSFLFSMKAQDVFAQAEDEVKKVFRFSSILKHYGMYNLAVIGNEHYALLALNLDMIPVNIG